MKNALIWLGVLVALVVVVALVARPKGDKEEEDGARTLRDGTVVRMRSSSTPYEGLAKTLGEIDDYGFGMVRKESLQTKCNGTGTVVAVAEVADDLEVEIDMVGDAEPEVFLTVVAKNLVKDGKVAVGQTVNWEGNMREIDLIDGVLVLTCRNGSAKLAEE